MKNVNGILWQTIVATARTGGTEWFLTSLKFLDKIAETLKFEILVNIEDVADIINWFKRFHKFEESIFNLVQK